MLAEQQPPRRFPVTWHLWRQIQHPRYRNRAITAAFRLPRLGTERLMGCVGTSVFFYVIATFVLSSIFPGNIRNGFLLASLLVLPLGLLFLALTGTGMGALWAGEVGATLKKAQQQGTYDLLAVSPLGHQGATWQLAIERLHQDAYFAYLPEARFPLTVPQLLGIALGLGVLALFPETFSIVLSILILVLWLLIIITDYIQAGCTALLVAILAAQRSHSVIEARLLAIITSLILQFVLGGTAIFGILLLERTWPRLLPSGLSIPLALLLLYSLKEITLLILWHLSDASLTQEPNR